MTALRSIACALPERELSNAELERENPGWEMARVVERAGVRARHVAAPDETAFDLSARACELLAADIALDRIDALVYCTQTPDHPLPGNAHLLHRHLGLGDKVLAFDYNLACSGYPYGLAFADSFIRGGLASEVLLVTADTYSKRIHPGDRSARVLFGDGATVTHVSGVEEGGGRIVACELCTRGSAFEAFYVPAGGARRPIDDDTGGETADRNGNVRSAESIHMDGVGVWAFVTTTLPTHIAKFLARRSLSLDDVDLFVFHQASRLVLDSLTRNLALEPGKVFVHMEEVGNLVSASIPFALKAALDGGAIAPGDRVLLSGYGAGMSYGSVLVEY
jgi:3-oxoacyl-[acyl-carrier-protein] synthase-3